MPLASSSRRSLALVFSVNLNFFKECPGPPRSAQQNTMVIKIRLARFGRKHAPIYNIVVAQARTARNSKPIEVLGTYDPIPKPAVDGEGRAWKDIKLDSARAKYWLGVGAQPSDPVWRLLAMLGLLEPKYRRPPQIPPPFRSGKKVMEGNVAEGEGEKATI